MTLHITPAKIHGKTHARNHARIQKKWLKRYGASSIVVHAPAQPAAPEAPPRLSRRARSAVSAARAAIPWDAAEEAALRDAKLLTLCANMLAEVKAHGYDSVRFNIADLSEKAFIAAYFNQHAPHLVIYYYINEEPA